MSLVQCLYVYAWITTLTILSNMQHTWLVKKKKSNVLQDEKKPNEVLLPSPVAVVFPGFTFTSFRLCLLLLFCLSQLDECMHFL